MAGFDYNQLIAPGIGAGAAFLGSIPQMVEARRLRKERERLMAEGAPGMSPIEQEQMAAARARAASPLARGYKPQLENEAELTSTILGAVRKAGPTSSNLMNTLARLNQQGQASRRNLVIRGEQEQRAAQGDLSNISMMADARRQGRVQDYEAKMAAMDAARRQYNAQAGMAPIQGAMAFMPLEGIKAGTGAVNSPRVDVPEMMEPMTPSVNLSTSNSRIGVPEYTPTLETMNKPYLNATYQNMFDPNAARRRMNMRSQAMRPTQLQNRYLTEDFQPQFNPDVDLRRVRSNRRMRY